MNRGLAIQYIVLIIGAVLLVGVLLVSSQQQPVSEPVALETATDTPTTTTTDITYTTDEVKPTPEPVKPVATTPKPQAPKPAPAVPSTPTLPVVQPPEVPVVPTPAPVAWEPTFLANSRITPEIPSENERALLPSCDGKKFTGDPVDIAAFTKIDGLGSTHGGAPYDFANIYVPSSSADQLFYLYAPGDIYITHIAQKYSPVKEEEESTIYFALCKDVFGYISHVKNISEPLYKMVTDSLCFGKPHTGANACYVQVLQLISRGESLGKVGGTLGSFGFGVFDLRTPRGLTDAASLPIKTNYARCPIDYLSRADAYAGRLSKGGGLCD